MLSAARRTGPQADTDGWTDTTTLVTLIAGFVLMAVFVVVEQRVALRLTRLSQG